MNRAPARTPSPPATQQASAPPPVQATARDTGLVATMARRYNVEPERMLKTLKDTAFKQPFKDGKAGPEVTNEQMLALLVVANEYQLNPFLKEIYAFAGKGGGIVPMIGFDGWMRLINNHPQLESLTLAYSPPEENEDPWVECSIRRKDRPEPVVVREYYVENKRNTEPWDAMPRRMLRHRAIIQAGRVAFGFGGVYDPDEGERIRDAMAIDGEATEVRGKPATTAPQATSSSAPQLTHVPVEELRGWIDRIGLGETEFCARFEIGAIDELPLNQVATAREYLETIERNNAGG